MNVLGVRIDNYSHEETLNKIVDFLQSDKQHEIFTPNPEMLVDAQKDEYFRNILNGGDLNVCDGVGLSLVSGIKRYPGVELMLDICELAEKNNKSVYFLGSGSDAVISNLKLVIKNKFPKLKIAGTNRGHRLLITNYQLQVNGDENDEVVHNIIMLAPDILFVAFGHGKQEKWIHENLRDLPSVKIAMGVGGAFDYISGSTRRAPLFLRQIGLEWLYRLIKQPSRFKRIIKATVIFVYYFAKSVISK